MNPDLNISWWSCWHGPWTRCFLSLTKSCLPMKISHPRTFSFNKCMLHLPFYIHDHNIPKAIWFRDLVANTKLDHIALIRKDVAIPAAPSMEWRDISCFFLGFSREKEGYWQSLLISKAQRYSIHCRYSANLLTNLTMPPTIEFSQLN